MVPERRFEPSGTLRRLYPEAMAGGYTRHDGFVEFYTRVNALLSADSRVLDFGAGRGQWATEPLPDMSRWLRAFHERVKYVAGVDVDPVVTSNPTLDEATVLEPGAPLPFSDESFDLVLADYVLEHIGAEQAQGVATEIMRVLTPGGWLAARTPNKWGLIGLSARAVPNRLHTKVLARLQPGRRPEDVFPVAYQMNTPHRLRRLFPAAAQVITYGHASEPRYFGDAAPAWRMAALLDRLTPPPLAPTLMVFVQKG
jgi:SAM-dependent methyltransferase